MELPADVGSSSEGLTGEDLPPSAMSEDEQLPPDDPPQDLKNLVELPPDVGPKRKAASHRSHAVADEPRPGTHRDSGAVVLPRAILSPRRRPASSSSSRASNALALPPPVRSPAGSTRHSHIVRHACFSVWSSTIV